MWRNSLECRARCFSRLTQFWYVACTRARDLLVLPFIPQASKNSWFSSIDLRQNELPEIDLAGLPEPAPRITQLIENKQSPDVFAAERQRVEESVTPIHWRRPSDHDPDRLGDPLECKVVSELVIEHQDVVAAGALRGTILHKLMEELLTGELRSDKQAVVCRADILLAQLASCLSSETSLPAPAEMAETALQALALPEIAALRHILVPEMAVWGARDGLFISGRADALAIGDNRIDVAIDWKSDINPTASVRSAYIEQLQDYLEATGARRGALVFLSLREITWIPPKQ